MNTLIFKVLTFLFILFNSLNLHSQNFEGGLQTGYGISNVYVEDISGDTRGVFHIGALGQYNFNESWAIVGKLLYDQKGYAYNDGTSGRETINYVDIPVMGKWYFGNNVKGYLQFGGYYGLFLNAEGEIDNEAVDTSEAYEDSDLGVAYGVGLELANLYDVKLFLEWEANTSMVNIAAENYSTFRNGASKIGLGFRYIF